ncbi:hypothetical protein GmHk_20G059224 [Glycine max]|nr:hypothetical protein GmHk_20G059224 [Glycine max]
MVIVSPGNMNGGYFDELDTPDGSDYEGPPKVIFPRFMVPENDEDINFKNLKVKKNDNKKVIAICKKKGCPFYLRVSKSIQATYWQVVTFKDDHCCFRTARNSQVTPAWVTKRLMSLLMHTPYMKPKALIAYAAEKWESD